MWKSHTLISGKLYAGKCHLVSSKLCSVQKHKKGKRSSRGLRSSLRFLWSRTQAKLNTQQIQTIWQSRCARAGLKQSGNKDTGGTHQESTAGEMNWWTGGKNTKKKKNGKRTPQWQRNDSGTKQTLTTYNFTHNIHVLCGWTHVEIIVLMYFSRLKNPQHMTCVYQELDTRHVLCVNSHYGKNRNVFW